MIFLPLLSSFAKMAVSARATRLRLQQPGHHVRATRPAARRHPVGGEVAETAGGQLREELAEKRPVAPALAST